MVRNTEMTLRHQLYTAARLLANEHAIARVLQTRLEDLLLFAVERPVVIVDDDRVQQAYELILRLAGP